MNSAAPHPPRPRRPLVTAAGVAAAFFAAGLAVASPRSRTAGSAGTAPGIAAPGPREFPVRFAAVKTDGIDMIWTGEIATAPGGEVTVRLSYTGNETDRALPLWPVGAVMLLACADVSQSFAAELTGDMDWETGVVRLHGIVTNGWRRGARIEQRLRLDPKTFTGSGVVRVSDAALAR